MREATHCAAMGFSPIRALIDMPLPWSRPPPKVSFESRDLLDMCKTLATSNMVTVPALRQIKAWLSGGIDPNAVEKKNKINTSCLMYATKGGHYHVCELLIRAGASVDNQNLLGDTALSIACSRANMHRRYVACAKLLLRNGANANTWDKNGYVPLCWAAVHGQKGLARALLEHGARQNIWANRNYRPAPLARRYKHPAVEIGRASGERV